MTNAPTEDPTAHAAGELGAIMRAATAAASQIATRVAKAREEQQRQAEAGNRQRSEELRTRLEAEKRTARLSVAAVHDPTYWDSASAQDVAMTYATAHAWEELDPKIAAAADRIRHEVHERYGVNVEDLNTTEPEECRDRQAQDVEPDGHGRDASARGHDEEHDRAAAEAVELAAAAVLAEAVLEDAAASREHQLALQVRETTLATLRDSPAIGGAGPVYDTRERREVTRAELTEQGRAAMAARPGGVDKQLLTAAVNARMITDVSQARPAGDAVAIQLAPGAAATARRAQENQQELTGAGGLAVGLEALQT